MYIINNSKLKIFNIVTAFFSVDNKNEKSWFFEETFLFTNIGMNVIFGITSSF